MSPHFNFGLGYREFPVSLTLTLLYEAFQYLLGWIPLRLISRTAIPAWRAVSFFLGLFLVWAACGSPLAAYDHSLLTVHMIEHLLLMTVAPALILLGEPLRVFWIGTPLVVRGAFRRVLQRSPVRQFTRMVTRPAVCWTFSATTLLAWHLPALFTLGMRSNKYRFSQPGSYFGGLLSILGQAPQLGHDGRCFCIFFWRLCRATSFPDFLSSRTVSHTQCTFPLRGCLVFPF
jgi:cytochrome c oxidase assembly factor CtaG